MKTITTKKNNTFFRIIIAIAMVAVIFVSCSSSSSNPNKDLTKEAFTPFYNDAFEFDSKEIRKTLNSIINKDKDNTQTDGRVRKMYAKGIRFLWIDRHGVDQHADTLLSFLRTVSDIGFSEDAFYVKQIENDIRRLRQLDFEGKNNDINTVTARLEYRLTKAYLRYCTGQRFGFTNPFHIYNNLDPTDDDSTCTTFRHLFDIPISRPDETFYQKALHIATTDSIGDFLRSIQPKDQTLEELRKQLANASTERRRWLLMCNMERHRWRRTSQQEDSNGRMVVVNVPSFMLYAYGPDSIMTMKMGCGATKTKTPLLTSAISRMDINPLWNIPMSIIRDDVAEHAGNNGYFASRRYFIVEKSTGKRLDPSKVTATMLKSGLYRVSQEGGEGNSLGRIIFRFDNKFSVYLHDTSSPKFFKQDIRSVSHGCVRIERPFDFARYLLGDEVEPWTLDRIRISMDMQPETEKGLRYVSDTTKTRKLINSLSVKPQVPIYIIYQTLFRTPNGKWEEYKDIYGYDAVMRQNLSPFVIMNGKMEE
ncbi:MAG: L,D-transpeptidase family protein [Prevotella sp.]